MASSTVANYELDKRIRVSQAAPSADFAPHKSREGSILEKRKCNVCIAVSSKQSLPSSEAAIIRAGQVFLEISIAFDPEGVSAPLPTWPCFYWSGPLTAIIMAHPSILASISETPLSTLAAVESIPVSPARLEDLLVCKKTEFVVIQPPDSAFPIQFFWVVNKVAFIELKQARLFHNCNAFPLLFASTPADAADASAASKGPVFHLVTNIDRNSLYPSYVATDALVTALLEKLRKLFAPKQQRWCLTALDKHSLAVRFKSASRQDYENFAAELMQASFNRRAARASEQAAPPSYVAGLQIIKPSSSSESLRHVEKINIDLVANSFDATSCRTLIHQAGKFLVLSKLPTTEIPKPENKSDSSAASSTPDAAASELYLKTKKKFGQLLGEFSSLSSLLTNVEPIAFNPWAADDKKPRFIVNSVPVTPNLPESDLVASPHPPQRAAQVAFIPPTANMPVALPVAVVPTEPAPIVVESSTTAGSSRDPETDALRDLLLDVFFGYKK